jgi:hypothetical protein
MKNTQKEIFDLAQSSMLFTDERTFMLKLSFFWRIIIWIFVTGSLITGWIAKSAIYLHIFKTNIKDQPINILILMEQIVHHICGNFLLVNITFSLPLGLSIGEMVDKYIGNVISGNTYCWIYFYIQILNLAYRGADGLSIAVIRFFYIKKGSWVKYKFGERKLLFLFGIAIWTFSCVMMYLYGSENISNRSLYNMCKGHTQAFEVILNSKLVVQKAIQLYNWL